MAASPIASGSGSQAGDENDPLELTSLDADSLFAALGAVEKAVPGMLSSVKPVLRHLTTGTEYSAKLAEEGVEDYMNTLDKIQFILRQTVYYLRETHASPSALRPPAPNALPTPFATTLAPAVAAADAGKGKARAAGAAPDADGAIGGAAAGTNGRAVDGQRGAELGLYGARMEARVLAEMAEALGRIQDARREGEGSEADREDDKARPAPAT